LLYSEVMSDDAVTQVTPRDGVAAAVAHAAPSDLPTTLGKYRVLLQLGRGGMATVYLAVTESAAGVNKLVALKALLPGFASEPEALAMFLDEARLAVQLNHGNLVQTYEVGQEGDRHVIAMEYLEGQSLAHVQRRSEKRGQQLPLGLHLRVLIDVLEALHYTHELTGYDGVPLHPVHRDVSPQNVFITYDGRTKLLDFGIAKAATSTTHTAVGSVKGKIAYMSPEQLAGEAVDRRADIYSTGCMLWAAAAGQKLWKDLPDARILRDVMLHAIPSPRHVNPDCDPELERIVMKSLARAPERYASALELQHDLERFCENKGVQHRPREIARFVTEAFSDVRAEQRATVERELSRVTSGVVGARTATRAATPQARSLAPDPQQFTALTQTVSVSTSNASVSKVRSKPLWGWAVAGLFVVGGGLSALLTRSPPSVEAEPASSVRTAASAAAAPEPLSVHVTLRSSPSTAQLFLDGKPVAGNPALHVFPKNDVVYAVRAELPGHHPATAEFNAKRDAVVELTLQKLPPDPVALVAPVAPVTPARKTRAGAAARKTATKPALRESGCAQPFIVGADGIRRVKPNCF
jgi:eukaryotic-like serine/threonine-protein kinase